MKMRVKVFSSDMRSELEDLINEFFASLDAGNIMTIQYSTHGEGGNYTIHSALVVYMEDSKDEVNNEK